MSKHALPKRASASGFAPKVDGRRLRGARTRQRVIDALLELVREEIGIRVSAKLLREPAVSPARSSTISCR